MKADKAQITRLLKTARGQLDGLLRMVEEDRYCIEISNQLMAVDAILRKANREVLRAHLEGCVKDAFAGGSEYFQKGAYIVVALAPLVVWGAVFLALNLAMGEKYFWFIYLLQMVNVSGAAGDLYVAFRFLRMPKDVLVQDTGVSMTVFTRNG